LTSGPVSFRAAFFGAAFPAAVPGGFRTVFCTAFPQGGHEEIAMTEPGTWDHEMTHEKVIAAPPELVWRALSELRPADLPIAKTLFWLRGLPGALRGSRFQSSETLTLLDGARQARFSVLTYDEPKLVEVGRIAKFWQASPTGGPVVTDRAEFDAFDEPDFAKAIMAIALVPHGSGTLVTTTTRIKATDDGARRKFGRYWGLIKVGSATIRRAMLSGTERRAKELAA
jgi:hypothetical protein